VSRRHRPHVAVDISDIIGSEQTLDRALFWLNTCIYQHVRTDAAHARLPTRVLLIDGIDQVRLYIIDGEFYSYACLSHCWGTQPLSLLGNTTATLEDFQTSIPWKDLPNTSRDAINFTYRLGVKYVWINSLLIVQDSIADRRREGSLMVEIYEFSYLTLVATKSSTPSEGCFSTPDRIHCTRSVTITEEENDGITQDYTLHIRNILDHHVGIYPIFNRGWVITLLSCSELPVYLHPQRSFKKGYSRQELYTLPIKSFSGNAM
jgi:hypothetical protein